MEERVAALLELLGGVGDVVDLEFDRCLGPRDVGRPLLVPKAGLGSVLEGPQSEVLDPLHLLAVEVPVGVFEIEAEGVDVETLGRLTVGDDGGEAGDEEDVHATDRTAGGQPPS